MIEVGSEFDGVEEDKTYVAVQTPVYNPVIKAIRRCCSTQIWKELGHMDSLREHSLFFT